MARYKIWNGTDDIYTLTGEVFTPEQWREQHKWLSIPGAKMIIAADSIFNGAVAMEFTQTKSTYKRIGASITDDMSDDEVLAAIEQYEDNPPITVASPTERIAAALEAQVMMSEDDVEEASTVADTNTNTNTTLQPVSTMRMRSVASPLSANVATVSTANAATTKSAGYDRAKHNYERGLWNTNIMKVAVKKGHITSDEYHDITGETYS